MQLSLDDRNNSDLSVKSKINLAFELQSLGYTYEKDKALFQFLEPLIAAHIDSNASEYEEELSDLRESVDDLENEKETLEETIEELEQDKTDLEEKVNNLNEELENLKSNLVQ